MYFYTEIILQKFGSASFCKIILLKKLIWQVIFQNSQLIKLADRSEYDAWEYSHYIYTW